MKNALLIVSTIAAVSCSSTAVTDQTSIKEQKSHNHNSYEHDSESSLFKNMAGDTAITTSIKKKYLNDDRINSFNIRVVTINGKVKLTGTVPSEEARQAAVSIAEHTKGVEKVETNLVVSDASLIRKASSDAIITSKIKLSYIDDSDISSTNINVKTVNGNVVLTGTVADEATKNKVINIAKDTHGVKKVNADLKIDKSSFVKNIASDSAITSAIKLKYLQDDVLSTLDIHVSTINNEVTLSGVVKNNEEKERAISIAKLTNGVTNVISRLKTQKN